MKTATYPPAATSPPEPAWKVAKLFPNQAQWSELEYLELNGNRLIEFTKGYIEVLGIPTDLHQAIVAALFEALLLFVRPARRGTVRFAPLRVRLWPGKYREPDVMFLAASHDSQRQEDFWDGADLVMEVVSDDDRRRDLENKRFEYTRAGIAEYWVVDPQRKEITVLTLAGQRYEVHGTFTPGEKAESRLLAGFQVSVADVFAAP
jgi:Uma2 family endonuclease